MFSQKLSLKTRDGVRLDGLWYQGGYSKLVVVAHGFFQNKDTKITRQIAETFFNEFDVLVLDFRGHGTSGGRFTLTARESEDLMTYLESVKNRYEKIGVIGFSLGGAIAIQAASRTKLIRSIISIAAPATFGSIDYHFWRKEAFDNLIDNFSSNGIGKGVRLGNPFLKKLKPLECISNLNNTPIFFIHGTHDWLIRPRHSQKLYEYAPNPKRIRIVENGLHAEKMYDQFPDELKKWTLDWFRETL